MIRFWFALPLPRGTLTFIYNGVLRRVRPQPKFFLDKPGAALVVTPKSLLGKRLRDDAAKRQIALLQVL